ncbi:MAG: transposase [Alkaliphilus sp.]
MPRAARRRSKSGIYHIVLRGVNKQRIFEDDEDAENFLQTIGFYKEKSEYKIYDYCLMGNHIHLLIKEVDEEFGISMRRIGASYVYWYNWKHQRSGIYSKTGIRAKP